MALHGIFCTEQGFSSLELANGPKLIDPWLAPGSIALLFGTPSAGKTMLMTTLMHALAKGERLFDRWQCAECNVLLVQADMNNAMFQERLRASAAQHAPNIRLLLTDAMSFEVRDVRASDPLIAQARDFNPQVVFVDTLRKTHSAEENAADSADRVYGAWRTLFPGCTFIFGHHTRKVPAQNPEDALNREAFRGNTAWAASADTLIMLRRIYGDEWRTQMRFVRTRGCIEPEPLTLALTDSLTLSSVSNLEHALTEWFAQNPDARTIDAVKWLQSQGLSRAAAYKMCERVNGSARQDK